MTNAQIVEAYEEGKKVYFKTLKAVTWHLLTNFYFDFEGFIYKVEEPKTLTCLDFAGWWYREMDHNRKVAMIQSRGKSMDGKNIEYWKDKKFSKDLKTWVTWQQREEELNK